MSSLASKTKKGLQWSAIERILSQGAQLGISLLLARLLGPEAFGLVGMLAVFIAIANVFIESGFTSALIRKPDLSENDFVTAFYYNIAMAIVVYTILYIFSPYVASFYRQPELSSLLRVLALAVFFNSFTLIPRVKLNVDMDFKTQAKISITSVIISGSISILLAFYSFGVWALVFQTIINSICCALLFNTLSPWRPRGVISRESFGYLFGYGCKVLIAGLLDVIYNNLYQIVIGRKFSPSVVGQYTQANQLSSLPAITLTTIIQRVTFPLFSYLQESPERMALIYNRTIKAAAITIFPIIVGLGLIAKPLLTELLGVQWLFAANLLGVLCLGYMLYPIHVTNLTLLQVMGRSDLFLKLEVIKKINGIIILLLSIPHGVLMMCIGFSVASYLSLFLNAYYTATIIQVSQWQQFKAIIPIWLAVMLSSLVAYAAGFCFQSHPWIQILVNIAVALLCYLSYLFAFERQMLSQLYHGLHHSPSGTEK